jgi:hypothetical protein
MDSVHRNAECPYIILRTIIVFTFSHLPLPSMPSVVASSPFPRPDAATLYPNSSAAALLA